MRGMTTWLRIGVTIVALFFLFSKYSPTEVVRLIAGAGWTAFLSACALFLIGLLLMTCKWSLVMRGVPLSTLFHAILVSCFYSILPTGQLGGEVTKVLIVKARHPATNGVLASIIFDKITGLLGLLLFGSAALMLSTAAISRWQLAVLGGLTAACAAFIMFAPLGARLTNSLRLPHPLLQRLQNSLEYALKETSLAARDHRTLVQSMLLGVLSQGAVIACYLVLAPSLGLQMEVAALAGAVAIANLAALVPISIGGFGVREMGLVAILTAEYAASGERALALSLTAMCVFLLAAMVGGLLELTSFIRGVRAQ